MGNARGATRQVDNFDITEAIGLYENGLSLIKIAEQLGTNYPRIRRRLLEKGIVFRQAISVNEVDWGLVEKQYLDGESLSKIAKGLDCSASFVGKELKTRGVDIRDSKTQVSLDCANGVDGHAIVNEQFFDTWSPQMAYVLGWIVSDGNIANTLKTFRICSTDIEHLRNIANIFSSGAHIIMREFQEDSWKTAGELSIGRRHMVDSLVKLGITPHKSNTVKMPDIPDECFGHFLRGVFEGDGHVGINLSKGKYPQMKIVIVSGSFDFVDALGKRIEKLIGPRFKGVCFNQSVWHLSYYCFSDCKMLFDAMYNNVPRNMILERKYLVFKIFFASKGGDGGATDEHEPGGLRQNKGLRVVGGQVKDS